VLFFYTNLYKDFILFSFGRSFRIFDQGKKNYKDYTDKEVYKIAHVYKISFSLYFSKLNNLRKYILKKYVYTINHKRIALNYLYFSMITGLSGAALATMIRLELSYPGSPFF